MLPRISPLALYLMKQVTCVLLQCAASYIILFLLFFFLLFGTSYLWGSVPGSLDSLTAFTCHWCFSLLYLLFPYNPFFLLSYPSILSYLVCKHFGVVVWIYDNVKWFTIVIMPCSVSQQMSSADRLALVNLAEYKGSKWNLHPSRLFLVSQTIPLQKCYKQALGYVI